MPTRCNVSSVSNGLLEYYIVVEMEFQKYDVNLYTLPSLYIVELPTYTLSNSRLDLASRKSALTIFHQHIGRFYTHFKQWIFYKN